MKTFHVVSVSIGTGLLLCMLTGFLVIAVAVAMIDVPAKPSSSPSLRPRNGAIGEIESQINELKYGPVNLAAAKEVKNGLLTRIRANRQARHRGSVSPQAVCSPRPQSVRIVDPSDCNFSYVVANPVAGQTIVAQPTGFEMPALPAINPIEVDAQMDCTTCKTFEKNAVKTGSFLCSNCRKSQVGEWHTDWKSDGTPITFLCKNCHSLMSPEQREKAYVGYLGRQSKSAGIAGLLYQEIGN